MTKPKTTGSEKSKERSKPVTAKKDKPVAKKTAPHAAAPRKAAPAAKTASPPKAPPAVTKPAKSAAPAKPAPPATKPKAAPAKPAPAKPAPVKPAPVKPAPAKKVESAVKPAKPSAPAKPAPEAAAPKVAVHKIPANSHLAEDMEETLQLKPLAKGKMLPREFLTGLAAAIREVVLPWVSSVRGREIVGQAPSGDATFEIDRAAEKALVAYLKQAKLPVAYYSEDEGYATFSSAQPQNLLIVDPIDGTRAAKCGFESCVIAIASTRVIERPRMADLDSAIVMEIMTNRFFYAERGKGVRLVTDDHVKRPKLSKNTNLETVSWSMTVPARPAKLIFPTAAELIDVTSLKGGFFACNSTSFSLTRLLTNQLDACVDFANRYFRDIPELVRDQFINAGRGAVLGIAPYDMAAGLLIAQEAGAVVTDAYGKSFDEVLLLDSGENNLQSMIAAANPELHRKLLALFERRIAQYEELLRRRAHKSPEHAE